MSGEPRFTAINRDVCCYCRNIAIGEAKDGWTYGCGVQKEDGGARYLSVIHTIFYKGCERFEPSGLPAHPFVVGKLIERNKLASGIPVDNNATETSYDFVEKMLRFPHVKTDEFLNVKESV